MLVILALLNDALVDSCRVLLMLVILAFVADTFVKDAVMIETLLNDALVDSCNILLTYKFVKDAVVIHTLLNEALVDS